MTDHRAAAEALFKGGPAKTFTVERVKRRTVRNGSIHDTRVQKLDLRAIAERLRELESMAARLTVSRTDPEKFHSDRSEIKAGIGAIAKQFEGR